RVWTWLSEPMRLRVRQYFSNYDFDSSSARDVIAAASVAELGSVLLERFRSLAAERQVEVIRDMPHPIFVADGIRLYNESPSFRSAEYRGNGLVLPLVRYYTANNVIALLEGAKANNQIWHAG